MYINSKIVPGGKPFASSELAFELARGLSDNDLDNPPRKK